MNESRGKIISINISKEKGTVKTPVDGCVKVSKLGIDNDAHSGEWHRQVSLLSLEKIKEFSKEVGRDIKPGEFAENITTEGLDLSNVRIGDRFLIGKVILEVTQLGKKCHGEKCAIYNEVGKCVMPREGIFCRVISNGNIKVNDDIVHMPIALRIAIVTVSDRASKRIYEDKSGPAIENELLNFFKGNERWRLSIHKIIVSDDAEDLSGELKLLCRSGFDIIFTTGGTGIGPRDNTIEVVKDIIDKEIPGIMDFIRVKYGYQNPNVLLSRSIAGVVYGKILIYTLPGSLKGVKEYCSEILPTLEHSIFMLRNIDTH